MAWTIETSRTLTAPIGTNATRSRTAVSETASAATRPRTAVPADC
jgi:hypothetical protein